MITFRRMTQEDFDAYYPRTLESLVAELVRAYELPPAAATAAAEASFRSKLPDGRIDVPNQHFYVAVSAADGEVGVLWFGTRPGRGVAEAYVYDIVIDERFRGRGYGRQVMTALEDEVRALGLGRIALNVFHHNAAARHLYEQLGYRGVDHGMMKTLA